MFKVVASARIVPGKSRGRQSRRKQGLPAKRGDESNRVYMECVDEVGMPSKVIKTKWDRDPSMPSKKGKEPCVTICISLPSQMFTNLYLFARKMRMNHSHLLRTALAEMMERNGWDLTRHMEGSNDGKTP